VFFTATRNAADGDLPRFADALAQSSLPDDARAHGVRFAHWEAALATAAIGAAREQPSVIVIDEFPYLEERSDDEARAIESMFSAAWERRLSRVPVILILVGSDLTMMERLTEYGRPLYDRPTRHLIVDPLTPQDIATIVGVSPEDAFDAYAVIGGLPAFADDWKRAGGFRGFLLSALSHPDTPFVNSGVRILDAEFPTEIQPRLVLSAIGHGERTSRTISAATGIPVNNLDRSLKLLSEAKRVVRVEEPLSAQRLKAPRHSVADPYLRFWLRFVEPALPEIERLRTERVVDRIVASWPDFRGRAIEPIVRSALERLLPDPGLPGADYVGSYWTRTNDPEVDLIGADKREAPAKVAFTGSIKWRDKDPFDSSDLERLIATSSQVPGVGPGTPLVAVSRTGIDRSARKLTIGFDPADLLAAYPEG
jgi:AAA+ ATPase superfamily predicted ATPase